MSSIWNCSISPNSITCGLIKLIPIIFIFSILQCSTFKISLFIKGWSFHSYFFVNILWITYLIWKRKKKNLLQLISQEKSQKSWSKPRNFKFIFHPIKFIFHPIYKLTTSKEICDCDFGILNFYCPRGIPEIVTDNDYIINHSFCCKS